MICKLPALDLQVKSYPSFEISLSAERLESYKAHSSDEPHAVIARYYWNVRLCEALYPSLNALEVSLRNNIHLAASRHFKTSHWFDAAGLMKREKAAITEARRKLKRRGKSEPSDGAIVAELSFGFWSNLLNKPYEKNLFRKVLLNVFYVAPRLQNKREVLRDKIDNVRRLRNRVFHHEPIWDSKELLETRNSIFELLYWIDMNQYYVVKAIDRFNAVYEEGASHFAAFS